MSLYTIVLNLKNSVAIYSATAPALL